VEYGMHGKVVGYADVAKKDRVDVQFDGCKKVQRIPEDGLSSSVPGPLPGGFEVNQDVYFTNCGCVYTNGDKLDYGMRGKVIGPADVDAMNQIVVQFDGNKFAVNTFVANLSCSMPQPLPEDLSLHQVVYYVGCEVSFPSGDTVAYGMRGTVVGPADDDAIGEVSVKFDGSDATADIPVKQIPVANLSVLQPQPLPGGFQVHQVVYFNGMPKPLPGGHRLNYGSRGHVEGPAEKDKIVVKFETGNKNTTVAKIAVSKLSHSKPAQLPAGFTVGQDVYFIGNRKEYKNELFAGWHGRVMIPADDSDENRIRVEFDGCNTPQHVRPDDLGTVAEHVKISSSGGIKCRLPVALKVTTIAEITLRCMADQSQSLEYKYYLVFESRRLDDDKTLYECGIPSGAELRLHRELRDEGRRPDVSGKVKDREDPAQRRGCCSRCWASLCCRARSHKTAEGDQVRTEA